MFRFIYVWAVIIVRNRRPRKGLSAYTKPEKIRGVDGIILLDIIWIGGGFISSSISIGPSSKRRRRRRDTPGKIPSLLSVRYFLF